MSSASSPPATTAAAASMLPPPPPIIRPPATTGDNGSPSTSLSGDVKRILALMEDERYLVAHGLYEDVMRRIRQAAAAAAASPPPTQKGATFRSRFGSKQQSAGQATSEADDLEAAKTLLQSRKDYMELLQKKCRLFVRAKANLSIDTDWTLAQTLFGITTYYRREEDGSLSIKMEGELGDVPLFEQICVLREIDLHQKWAPFCSNSKTIAHLDKLDTVGWFVVGLPTFGLARDGCFRAIGCDSMWEDGTIIIVAQGIHDRPEEDYPDNEYRFLSEDPVLNRLGIPEPPSGLGNGRMTIRNFETIIHVTSPTTASMRLIANVDPNLSLLPQSLLDFLMKKLCGVLLYKLQGAAKKIPKHPVSNPHARRMRREEAFYKHWLMEKFKAIAADLNWAMPPVAAFQLTDEQLEEEFMSLQKEASASKSKLYSSSGSGSGTSFPSSDGLNDEELMALRGTGGSTPSSEHGHPVYRTAASDPLPFEQQQSSGHLDDSISELSSSMSATTWSTKKRSNFISNFLAEKEEKQQARKAEAIAMARLRAQHRLKPKEFPHEMQARLAELRMAKERQQQRPSILGLMNVQTAAAAALSSDAASSDGGSTAASSMSKKSAMKKDRMTWAYMLNKHNRKTRFYVVTFLMTAFFALLNADSLLQWAIPLATWPILHYFATLVYIALCGVLHFVVCDVQLIYAFGSLELGMKSGRQAKMFYADNVRLVMASFSFGLTSFAVAKAVAWSILRGLVHGIIAFYQGLLEFGDILFWALQEKYAIPPGLLQMSGTAWNMTCVTTRFLLTSCHWILWAVWRAAIRSNFLGRFLEYMTLRILSSVFAVNEWMVMQDQQHQQPWSEMAVNTSRHLLSYTAVFLLSILLLFNFSAKKASRKSKERQAASQVTATPQPTSTKHRIPTIHEDQEVHDDVAGGDPGRHISASPSPPTTTIVTRALDEEPPLSPPTTVDTTADMSSSDASKRKRFRLGLRRKKKKGLHSNSL